MLFNISQVIHTGYVISVSVLAVMEIPDWSDLVADTPRASRVHVARAHGLDE
jgi:hypothetical protein